MVGGRERCETRKKEDISKWKTLRKKRKIGRRKKRITRLNR